MVVFSMKFRAYISLALLLAVTFAVHSEDPVPSFQIRHSVFRDAWQAILTEADIEPTYFDVTKAKARDMFAAGVIHLDCCSTPEWRTRPEELEVQLFSEPFFFVFDHLILQKGRDYKITDPNNLSDYKVAVVKGYSFKDEMYFGERIGVNFIFEAFALVASKGADMTISNNQEFYLHQKEAPLPLVLGPVHGKHALRARVHRSRADLLPKINMAISRLKANGRITLIMAERLRGKDR